MPACKDITYIHKLSWMRAEREFAQTVGYP